jgi:hypothetical protein
MSSKGHNKFVGIAFAAFGVIGVAATVIHFTLAKSSEAGGIISKEDYENIAEIYVPIANANRDPAKRCVPMESFGTSGVTKKITDRKCINSYDKEGVLSEKTLNQVADYNNFHSLQEKGRRAFGDVTALIGGGISVAGLLVGIGYTND